MEENPFKQIEEPLHNAPEELKNLVMENVNTLRLLIEMSSNFKKDYEAVIASILKTDTK